MEMEKYEPVTQVSFYTSPNNPAHSYAIINAAIAISLPEIAALMIDLGKQNRIAKEQNENKPEPSNTAYPRP